MGLFGKGGPKLGGSLGGLANRAVSQTFGGDNPWASARGAVKGASIAGLGGLGAPGIMGGAMRGEVAQDQGMPGANPYMLSQQPKTQADIIDPSELTQLNLQGQSMDPYRQAALQDIEAGTASGLAGAETRLAQTGGLSAADRMQLASQFNRDKIMGRQSALGKFAGMEADSAAQADRANQMFNAQARNALLEANRAARQQAAGFDRQERMLQRQLGASGQIADAQLREASKSPGGILGGSLIPGIL